MLRLHTFGGCHLAEGEVRLDALSGQRKALALLAVLAAAGERGVSRDTALASLWPESDEERARTSLRQLVHALRTQLKAPELLLPSAELHLNPAVIASDVADFRASIDSGDLEVAIGLYSGPFLDGFHLRGADTFERWAAVQRSTLAAVAAGALERLADEAVARGDVRRAVDTWRRLVELDPLSARATVGLMAALERSGERAAALQHARVYEALVRQEVDGTVDSSVTKLAERLRTDVPESGAAVSRLTAPEQAVRSDSPNAGGIEPAATAPAPQRPESRHALVAGRARLLLLAAGLAAVAVLGVLGALAWAGHDAESDGGGEYGAGAANGWAEGASVAVLPFVNTSGDAANEPFSDGLTDELIGALGKVPGLRVVGRTSTFALKGKGFSVRTVGDTLGVATVVEASVRRVDDRIKVTAHLVSVRTNTVLWTDTYDRTLTDVFAMQEEIARSIVAALRVRLVSSPDGVLVRHSTDDPVAYELYLRGRHIFYNRPYRDGVVQAGRYFAEALQRDPSYARAHAAVSDVHTRLAVFGYGKPREEFAVAKAAAGRALALDSTLAEAHAALAHVLCVSEYDWRGAERAFRRAIALDPGYTFARLPFAICLMSEGRFAEAVAQLDSARAADPIAAAPSNVLGRLYVSARQPERAIRHLNDALELAPELDLAYQQLGHAHLQMGRHAEAIAAFERAAIRSGIRDSAHLAYGYSLAGRRAEADLLLRSLVASASSRYVPPVHIAIAYTGLGRPDEAFRWLERGFEERASFMGGIKFITAFDPLHADPRWPSLLRRMGLTP